MIAAQVPYLTAAEEVAEQLDDVAALRLGHGREGLRECVGLVVGGDEGVERSSLGLVRPDLDPRSLCEGRLVRSHELLAPRKAGKRLGLLAGHAREVSELAVPVVEAV